MSIKKVKTPGKMFTSNADTLQKIITKTIDRVTAIVGSSLGPGGRNVIIESDLPGIPNKNTKDGVTIFKALGSHDAYEHLIIEQIRDVAIRTVNEVGDGPVPMWSGVLSPKGFVQIKDVVVGMDVCGTNGSIQQILGVYDKGQKEIYEIEFSNKGVVECCEDHLWNISTNNGTKKTIPLKQILKDYCTIDNKGFKRYNYFTPVTKVDFKENPKLMPIDPYLLGTLLGDGSLRDSGSIELSIGYNKKHIIDKIKLPKGITYSVQDVICRNSYRIKFKGKTLDNKSMRDLLDLIGLRNVDSKTKFIPKSYLYSSLESRQALLQGLIDTDGNINGDRIEYNSICEQLAYDFVELCRGLGKGVSLSLRNREKSNGYSKTPVYRARILKGYKYGDKIIRITPTGKFTEMRCIKVSNPDNLYITDNYVVTHNTTTSTIIAGAFIKNLFNFCGKNPKFSPQKTVRTISNTVNNILVPKIHKASIKINKKNLDLLKQVAKVSTNGDIEMSTAVMEAFELTGYSESSHVTIQELSGPSSYKVEAIEGYPIAKGYEESIGKFHAAFINDQIHQKCILDKPLFILFDGNINDMVQVKILERFAEQYSTGESEYKNIVIVAHKFSDTVLGGLAMNFQNPTTINVVPLATPISPIINSQLNFLMDLSAFTGAKIFDMNRPMSKAIGDEFGNGMERIEIYRFKTTIVGDPDPANIEFRASELKGQAEQSESKIEKTLLEERLGRLTCGIVQLKVFGASNAEIKEKVDRAEDAVCAVRAAISSGCLPGGCRVLVNLALDLDGSDPINRDIIMPSLFAPLYHLLTNAGYSTEEQTEIITKMMKDRKLIYDVENQIFGDYKTLRILDATLAVSQALLNASSIAGIIGTLGGIIAYPRDNQLELQHARDELNLQSTLNNAESLADLRNEKW